MAEVRSLQSQLHRVNGRSASGDRMILPLSTMSEVLGIKTVLLFGKMLRNGTSFQQILISVEKELGAQPSRTLEGAIRNSIRARCRICLQSNKFIKFGTINGPTDIVRSFLNIPQDIFVLVMPRAHDAGLKNRTPILTKPSSLFIFVFQGMTVFISERALRQGTGFLARQARCPTLHLAGALFFSVCVQGRFVISASRSARFSLVRFAIIWLSHWTVHAFKRDRLKAIFNGLLCFTTSHERPKMSISVGT